MEIDELPENDEQLLKKPENQLDKHRSARRAVAEYDARKDGTGRVAWNWSTQLALSERPIAGEPWLSGASGASLEWNAEVFV